MTRCVHCGWQGQHDTVQCVRHLGVQLVATKCVDSVRPHRAIDVRELRAALAAARQEAA